MISTWKIIGLRGLTIQEFWIATTSRAEARRLAMERHRFWAVLRVTKVY